MRAFDRAVEFEGGLIIVSTLTGEPRSMPKSRQSLAVKISGALTGTTPDATSLPLTFSTTLRGPAGLRST